MHKSTGNAVAPDEVIKNSGAEIIRLWCASSDYFEDMRCSDEILQRVTDGYRKLRNTARFALGNLHGFDPARDTVADEALLEIDAWALAELDEVIQKVREAYDAYEFHVVYHTLYNFCTVTLSARYFDIIKDRLYTFATRNQARRSAQTALYRIADALARMLATILVFTSDEIWENLPQSANETRGASVHLATLPEPKGLADAALAADWERLFLVRDDVLRSLEEARVAKVIGSSLEARVTLTAANETAELLKRYESELRYLFIVSQVELFANDALSEIGKQDEAIGRESQGPASMTGALRQLHDSIGSSGSAGTVSVMIERAAGQKCERCWNYSVLVGESSRYPTVCERCVAALEEIEGQSVGN